MELGDSGCRRSRGGLVAFDRLAYRCAVCSSPFGRRRDPSSRCPGTCTDEVVSVKVESMRGYGSIAESRNLLGSEVHGKR